MSVVLCRLVTDMTGEELRSRTLRRLYEGGVGCRHRCRYGRVFAARILLP